MDIKQDNDQYEELHHEFLNRMMHAIKDFLNGELAWRLELEQEPDPSVLADLAENIGFVVNAVIDGSDVVGLQDQAMPNLAFKTKDQLVVNEGGSYLHEMTMGSLEDWLFAQLDDDTKGDLA